MKDREVTERDVEVARQMGAPDDIVASMERGVWPSDLARWKVRNAEACIDYLADRYGLEFSAVSATGGPKWMTCYDDVYLRIESGPHAGEEVRLAYDSGMRNGRQEREPMFNEDCYYVVNHEGWERIAEEAIAPILAELPEGAWTSAAAMDRYVYHISQIDRPITEGGGTGYVFVLVDMDACGLSREDMLSLLDALWEALGETGLRGICCLYGYGGAADFEHARETMVNAHHPGSSGFSWSGRRAFGPGTVSEAVRIRER